MTRKKAFIILAVIIVLAAVAGANFYFKRQTGVSVNAEAVRARDLESIVSASGKIQPKTQVNISANTTGRVTRLAVQEGQRVKAGQFLLEIDPRSLEGQLQRGEASVAAARSSLDQAHTNVEQAKANLALAQQNLKRQQDLWKDGLTTKQDLERAQNDVAVRETDLKAREQDIQTREQSCRHDPNHPGI
jgi:HlyD family secretion protein